MPLTFPGFVGGSTYCRTAVELNEDEIAVRVDALLPPALRRAVFETVRQGCATSFTATSHFGLCLLVLCCFSFSSFVNILHGLVDV